MPTVVARLSVDDFDVWRAEYERMHVLREASGERGHRLYRDLDDPNTVVVVFEWDTVENARAYFTGAQLQASVRRARGKGAPDLFYLESA